VKCTNRAYGGTRKSSTFFSIAAAAREPEESKTLLRSATPLRLRHEGFERVRATNPPPDSPSIRVALRFEERGHEGRRNSLRSSLRIRQRK